MAIVFTEGRNCKTEGYNKDVEVGGSQKEEKEKMISLKFILFILSCSSHHHIIY